MCMDPVPTFVLPATLGQLPGKTFSTTYSGQIARMWPSSLARIPSENVPRHNRIQGKIANARAGNPDPPFGFGKLTTAIAPASGT
jgi:hypothetical protein